MTLLAVEHERTMEFVRFSPLSALTPWDKNYRVGDHDAIERSLAQFGLLGALRVRHGVVIAGNQTLATLRRMFERGLPAPRNVGVDSSGEWMIPTISADHLSDSEATAFAIADNRTHDLGADDEAQLGLLLQELVPFDLVDVAGYDLSAIEMLLDTGVDGGAEEESSRKEDPNYARQVEPPVYTPQMPEPPHLSELVDVGKMTALIDAINSEPIPDDLKEFLRVAAARHARFDYQAIAEYYAHASAPIQKLFEESALVIVDFESAIERGFAQLVGALAETFDRDAEDEDDAA